MNKKWLLTSLWGAACTLAASSLLGFNGHGFNNLTDIYQWDSGKIGSVVGLGTDVIDGFTAGSPKLTGNNTQSVAQGFDTRHRNGMCADVITAVQFAFTDVTDSFHSFQCREGHLATTTIPTFGLTVTIGIWPGTVAAGNQRRDNAIHLQDYTIQPTDLVAGETEPSSADADSDVGITSNFASICPAYECCCVDDLSPQTFCSSDNCNFFLEVLSEDEDIDIECTGCAFQGNGSNIRPLVAPYVGPCAGCTGCSFDGCSEAASFSPTCSFSGCTGCGASGPCAAACPFPPTNANGTCILAQQDHIRRPEAPCQHTGQDGRNPFSEYGAVFTTIVLDKAVKVEGEFWIGFLFDIPTDFPVEVPEDDLTTSIIGVSVVDFDATQPQPNGIDLSGLLTFDGTCCLENNVSIPVTTTNPQALHPIANGFSPIPGLFLTGGTFGNSEDEFYAIRAIPKNSDWWTLNNIPRAKGCRTKGITGCTK